GVVGIEPGVALGHRDVVGFGGAGRRQVEVVVDELAPAVDEVGEIEGVEHILGLGVEGVADVAGAGAVGAAEGGNAVAVGGGREAQLVGARFAPGGIGRVVAVAVVGTDRAAGVFGLVEHDVDGVAILKPGDGDIG